ncbi:endoplasmic reticulum mannosyl-oligosaccharide 1-2-alpha-mannosidase-like [Brachionus plicatilis]|uniref:alpha-1,2-Mannosidase n=1 Tax=Brachionus plicatilis TaxID=10195 RepID=A0A3M7QDQ7_BRAPC|nr:endoplasmic reticulum mannosyl-oligosaccharide 1-2-alpha-mannosidase-like [Brachionus plicatilis]
MSSVNTISSQYYSLNLGTIEIKQSRQSFYRYWNRLHRFQKTLVLIALFLSVLYVLSHIEFHHKQLKNIPSNHEHQPLAKDKNWQPIPDRFLDVKDNRRPYSVFKVSMNGPTNERQQKVVEAFLHAWKSYKEHAWGEDELKPISKKFSSWFNLGLTIVDSLDTMYIMNLQDQFTEARDWIEKKLNFDVDRYNNLFELTIRILGGLLSAYHLSAETVFLEKAYEFGNRSLPAFDTKSSIPYSDLNLMRQKAKSPSWTSDSSLSEVSTLSIEYNDLTYLTGDKRFEAVINRISQTLHRLNKPDGLAPIFIDTNQGQFRGRTITLGARGDSYYEYLLKQWIQKGAKYDKSDEHFYLIQDWLESVRGIRQKLVKKTKPSGYMFVGELLSETFSPKMDHLVCFLPGNLALGYSYLRKIPDFPKDDLKDLMNMAQELTETCYQMYAQFPTGLSPEIVYFNTHEDSTKDFFVKDNDRHNLLRPETVESLYYMKKITKDKKYEEYGWKIFEAFEKYTKVENGGYSSINDVTSPERVNFRDKMESFFLAETLKYLYLLFEDEKSENLDLKHWLINTEAHLIPIPNT